MLRRSLTIKILLAVGVTVAAVIAVYTYFVIRVQSQWWYERTQSQNMLAAAMVSDHLQEVMLSGRGEEVQNFLQHLKKSEEVLRGCIIDPAGTIIFSTEPSEVKQASFRTPPGLFTENRVLHGTRIENDEPVATVMAPIRNQASCSQCHDAKQPVLGAIILEKSMAPAQASVATNRNLLIAYGVVIFVLVGSVVWLLIMRFVAQPVRGLLQHMQRVEQGDLSVRAATRDNDEIGKLTSGFNAMVESLETTRRELHESHAKQIQQAGKLASIGELASGIAHEIRNPLAGIGAAVEVLAENSGGNGQYGEVAGEIHQQIARLNRTIRDLLEFARPREPEIAPCDVHEIIKPMLALVRPDAQKHGVRIVEEFAPDLPPIMADPQQLQQAILNILLNAEQAMPEGGGLTVRTEGREKGESRKGGRKEERNLISSRPATPTSQLSDLPTFIRILISDTGIGISRENLGKIFSPFFTTKHRGTGLGLSITRTIVEKQHGSVEVESAPGCGTTFTLEFAAAPALEDLGTNGTGWSVDTAKKGVRSHAKE